MSLLLHPHNLTTPALQGYLQSIVVPRPIAFASTVDAQGRVNLSPFSFFNLFSANPPILVFSPSRRVRNNSVKHTLANVREVPEVTINVVDFSMVEQASLASCDFPKDANEFIKAGFTEEPSENVRPPRVKESPVAMECKVDQVIPLGERGGAGNLVICEVLLIRVHERVLDESGRIDPRKLDAVARLGQDYYSRAREGLFTVPKPNEKVGVGIDQLPREIRESEYFTMSELARLANVEAIPGGQWRIPVPHQKVKQLLAAGLVDEAWEELIQQPR